MSRPLRRWLCAGAKYTLVCMLAACGSSADTGGPPEEKRVSDPDCIGCHIADYEGARRHANVKSTRCEVCHRDDRWHPIVRKHDWPLTGAHEKADCFVCHTGKPPTYEGTPRACIGCHRDDLEAINAKSKRHVRVSEVCEECHTTTDWNDRSNRRKGETPPSSATATIATPPPTPPISTGTSGR